MKQIGLIVAMLTMIQALTVAQETADTSTSKSSFDFSADIVSRYVWRGILFGGTPHIQPTASYSNGGFSAGVWGSYGVAMPFAEIDLFASYTYSAFTFTIFDYFIEDETDLSINNYFEWGKSATPHALEGTISFDGTEKIPFTFTAATFFYGNDWDSSGDNLFSTYLEIGYYKSIGSVELNLKIGGTPSEGMYATKAGIVHCSIGLSKEIELTDRFNLPVFTQFVVNPSAKDVFFVFGVTL